MTVDSYIGTAASQPEESSLYPRLLRHIPVTAVRLVGSGRDTDFSVMARLG